MIKQVWAGKLGEAEEAIGELEICSEDTVMEETEESQITKSDYYIYIPELGLNVHDGTFYCKSDEGEFEPDFSLAIVCDANDDEPRKWLYWEQDGVLVTLANYLHGQGYDITRLSGLSCELYAVEPSV